MPSLDITCTHGRSGSIVVATPWEVKLEDGTIRFSRAARNDPCPTRSNFTVSSVPSERNSNALYLSKAASLTPESMSAYASEVAVLFHTSSRIQKSSTTVSMSPFLPRCR